MTTPSSLPIILIAGATASGKSAFALRLATELTARQQKSVIINADASQVYRDLTLITARPSAAEEAQHPHRLYGFLDGAERGSVAAWLSLARAEIATALAAGHIPLVTGGTGLYLRALQQGLSPIPPVPEDLRQAAIELHQQLGGNAFKALLAEHDPHAAARLEAGDSQRLIRAYAVVTATGTPLHLWHAQTQDPPPPQWRFVPLMIDPPRAQLYAQCNRRFEMMLAAGAMDEVKQLLARNLAPDLPLMKAVGVPELAAVLQGTLSLAEATTRAQQMTRNYAKRQLTWFRNQMPEAQRLLPTPTAGEMQQVLSLLA